MADAFGLDTSTEEFGKSLYEEEQPETEESPEPQAVAEEGSPAEEAAPEAPTVEETQEERPRDEHGRFVSKETGDPEEPEVQAPEPEAEEVNIPASEEEQPRLWAGKYQTEEQLEQGYNESREQWRRAVEARKAEQQRAYEAEMREAELARVIQQSLPYLNAAAEREKQFHAFAAQYKEQMGQYPEGYTGPPTQAPNQGVAPEQVNQLIEQRLAQERAQMDAQYRARQEYEATANSIMGFYSDHPEVEPRSPADNAITDTLTVLNEAWASRDYEVDMSDRGTVEVLYEASKRPALQSVLAMKPDYFDSEAGLQLARMEAAVIEGAPSPTQSTQSVPASQVGKTSGQKKPFAESAVTGAEVLEEGDDDWSVIKREYAKGKDPKSVFSFE